MNGAYYNEIDPYAAQWLRNLIAAGHIAPGDVDERSIVEVRPDDLRNYLQCHFFAGIGVWSHALRSAGWADDRPVWTGSCPCQPFSAAGKGDEFADERHLWPVWFRLILECRPESVFGEQVASKDALAWLDHVSTDLEGEGYTFGAVDTCAAGFGAPHIRQRLYFVADDERTGQLRASQLENDDEDLREGRRHDPSDRSENATSELAYSKGNRLTWQQASRPRGPGTSHNGGMGNAKINGHEGRSIRADRESENGTSQTGQPTNGFWRNVEWLPCRDGKARPTEPGTFPLAHGATARVGRLRAYGNAICAPQAAEFVRAYIEVMP